MTDEEQASDAIRRFVDHERSEATRRIDHALRGAWSRLQSKKMRMHERTWVMEFAASH
jgi:hypothetical protein